MATHRNWSASATPSAAFLSAALGHIRSHAWLWWFFGILAFVALCASRASLRDYLWNHAGLVLVLPLPALLVTWLVAGAEEAREKLGSGQSCRRQ
jgi:hypothetical protein